MVTVIGMGVVFILLTVLVGVIRVMSQLSSMIEGRGAVEGSGAAPATLDDGELAGVIAAAIRAHRRRHGR